jgi:uncharacterized protein (TIGR03663 family)
MLAAVAGAAALRLPRLDARPMHADEANQAVKAGILWQTGTYHYDLTDHHGPSLYWLTLPSLDLSGAKDFAHTTAWSYRIVPAVFGVALVALVVLLADGLGGGAVVCAAVLTALSPAMVYYSRYYIQEMLLVTLVLTALGCGWRYVKSRRAGWALAAGAALGLAHATKETWVLSAAAMAAAAVLTIAWSRCRDGAMPDPGQKKGIVPICASTNAAHRCSPAGRSGKWGPGTLWVPFFVLLAAAAVACLVAAAFYSQFGANWRGPWDSIRAYANYWRRGAVLGLHVKPWYYYLQTLFAYRPARGFFWTEGLIAGLAAVGAGAAIFNFQFSIFNSKPAIVPAGESKDALPNSTYVAPDSNPQSPIPNPHSLPSPALLRFLTFYTVALTVLYAMIPYKTPWCGLGLLQGMTLLAGVGAWTILAWVPRLPGKAIAAAILAVGAAHLGWQAYELSFRFAADDRNPYAYAHTSLGVADLADRLQRLSAGRAESRDLTIHVVAENYWPLPWYLRQIDQERVGYWSEAADWLAASGRLPAPSILLVTTDLQATIDAGLRRAYNRQILYRLRPGVFLRVYVREDLWPAFIGKGRP